MGTRGRWGRRRGRWIGWATTIALVATLVPIELAGLGTAGSTVRAQVAAGLIDTFAGTGATGVAGDGGRATDARVGGPGGLAADAAGNVYVSQTSSHVIRRIDPGGTITTIAGDGTAGYTGDGDRATDARLSSPRGLTVGPDGALYVADANNGAIRRIDLVDGSIDTVVSPTRRFRETTHPDDADQGFVFRPHSLAFGPDGALYASACGAGACGTRGGHWIRRIDLTEGTIGTYAGAGTPGFSGDGGDRTAAQFSEPYGIAFVGADLLVADRSNRRVRRIDGTTGVVTTAIGTGRSSNADADGLPAEQADANLPSGVVADGRGAWYVSNNSTIVRVDPDGVAGTVAGLGPTQGDGGPSVLSQLGGGALTLLPDGRLLAAELSFHRVRVITPGEAPPAPAGVGATVVDPTTLAATIVPADGLTRLHEVRIDPPLAATRRIDERRTFWWEMPQAVPLDASTTRSTTFTGIDVEQVVTVEARAHNGWGFGPWRTFSLEPVTDPGDPTCRWAVGTSGSWHDPTRWSCGGDQRVPTIDDDVVIDIAPGGASLQVTMSANAEARSLVLGAMDTGRTRRHHLVMTNGVVSDPRTLTLGAGSFVVHRSGWLTTGRPTVFGVSAQSGWIGRITGSEGAPVEMVVHGDVEAFNMELTGNLTVAWPLGVTDGPPGNVTTRGATFATGTIDLAAGGAARVIVYRGEAPDTLPRPPRFAALGGDLTVADGGALTLHFETDTTGAAFDGQVAVATPAGRLVNHGRIRVTSRTTAEVTSRLGWSMTVAGPLDNHGQLVTVNGGLRLGGPNGTVHTNSGEVVVGDRSDAQFTEIGGPLDVNAGTTLANTGSIEIDHTRTASGAVTNEGGTVAAARRVSETGSYTLGFEGPTQVRVTTGYTGPARDFTMTWYGTDHPDAGLDPRVAGTGHWWDLTFVGDAEQYIDFLSVPRLTERALPQLCRRAAPDVEPPFQCFDNAFTSPDTVSVDFIGSVSEWVVAARPPDPEPEPEPEPYAFDLFDVDDTGPDLVNAVLLGQLSAAVYRWACGPVTCDDGTELPTAQWADAFSGLADDWRFSNPQTYRDDVMATDAAAGSIELDDATIVVFRGTEGGADWATNLNSMPFPQDIDGLGTVWVHVGFWRAVDSIYDDIVATIDARPEVPVVTTGHSLGGAMAQIAALRLRADGYDVRSVHTFGAPLVGDLSVSDAFVTLGLDDHTHRWAGDLDLVAQVLLLAPGYGVLGRDHTLVRNTIDDELDVTLVLDDIPTLRASGMNDHDVTRTVRRLHSLLDADVAQRLPVPYATPAADLEFEVFIRVLLENGADPGALAGILAELLRDTVEPVLDRTIEILLAAGATIAEVLAVLDEYTDIAREVIVATILEVLDRLGLLVERIVEAAAALAAALAVTTAELITFLQAMELDDETLAEVLARLAGLAGDLVELLQQLFGTIRERLDAWIDQLGIDLTGFGDLPLLLPDDLAAALDLDARWAAISAGINAQIDAALADFTAAGEAGLAEFLAALEALGFDVVHAPIPGVDQPAEGDLVEFLWTIDLLPSATELLADLGLGTDGLLDGLAASSTIGSIDADLDAALALTLRFGLDDEGPYLAPDTGIDLGIDGSIVVTGSAAALGVADTAISGSTTVDDLRLVVEPEWTGRVRLDDPGALTLPVVEVAPASTASTSMSLSRDLLAVTWTASASYLAGALALDAAVGATLPIPGSSGDGGPATLSLTGERVDDTWELRGTLPEEYLITIADVNLARIDNGRVEADITTESDGTTDLDVALLADALVLLPDLGAAGAVVIEGVDARLGTAGGFRLDGLDQVQFALPGGLSVVLDTVTIDLDGSPDDPILTAATGTFSVPGLDLTGQVTGLEIGRDGAVTVTSAAASTRPSDVLGDLAGFLPFELSEVAIEFPATQGQPIRLDQFVLTASGTLDLTLLEDALGADIEVRVGDTVVTEEEFDLQVVVESVSPLVISPVGADAVTVTMTGLDIGPLTFDATVLFQATGATTVVSGTVDVTGAGLDLDGAVSGTVESGVVTIALDVTAEATGFAGAELRDLDMALVLTGGAEGLLVESFTGSATVDVSLDDTTLTIPLSMSFVDGVFAVSGGLAVSGVVAFGFDGTTVVELENPTFTLDFVTTGSESTLGIGVSAAQLEFFPGLDAVSATGTVVTGSLSSSGRIQLTAASLDGAIADTFTFGTTGATLTLDPDPAGDPVVFSAALIEGGVPELGLELELTDLVVRRDGSVSVGSVAVETGQLEETLGIAGLFPFTIAEGGVQITFVEPENPLSGFTISVTGAFDLSKLDDSLGFTPVLIIGDRTLGGSSDDDGVFTFAVEIDTDPDALVPIRPVDLPPITLGFDDLTVGPLTFGATITFGEVLDGELLPQVSGTVRLVGAFDVDGTALDGDIEATFDAVLRPLGDGVELEFDTSLRVSGSFGEFLTLEDLRVDASMALGFDGTDFQLELPTLDGLSYGLLEIGVTDLVTFTSAGGVIDLSAGAGELLAVFGGQSGDPGLGIRFGDGAGPLADWEGDVTNVGLRMTAVEVSGVDVLVPVPVLLDGFAADIGLPDSTHFGPPEWVPLDVRSVGFSLPDDVGIDLDDLEGFDDGLELTAELAAGLRLRISGGLQPNDFVPITADLEGLEVSIGRLIDCALAVVPPPTGQTAPVCENPIIDLDGIAGGVEPFDLGPLSIGGVLGVGFVPVTFDDGTTDSVFYFRIAGEFTYSGIGAGVDLVISEYGPVLAKATVPLAIPLGQTSLLLTGVKGGIKFGGEGFVPPATPTALLTDPQYDLDFPITLGPDGTIAEALRGCAQKNRGYDWANFLTDGPPSCFTWNDGGTITLGATLTSYAAPGLISGDVTLAADLRFGTNGELPALRFAGNGNINVFGFPVGTTGFLLALDDPLAPVFDLAVLAPAPGSPLGFVMPAQGDLSLRIDTTGIALGTLLGLQAFIERLAAGTLREGQELFGDALAGLADELDMNHSAALSRLLLDIDADGELSDTERARTIDVDFMYDRLLGTDPDIPGLLPAPGEIPTDLDDLRELLASTAALTTELQRALFGRLADVADSYASELREIFAGRVDPLTAAILASKAVRDDLTSPMTDSRAQALGVYGQVFQDVLNAALRDSSSAFFEVFDPTFALDGALQPVILGMPLGEPVGGASLIINRAGVELGMTASPTTFFLYGALVGVGAGAFSPALAALNDQLGFSDRVTVRAQLPFTGIIDTILAEGPLAIDPFDAEWNVTLDAELTVAGLSIGRLTGLLVSPRNDTVLDNRIWRTYDPLSVFGPDKIPVRSAEHFEAIERHGGLVLNADLDAPHLLVDPAATLADLELAPPEGLLDYPDWVQQNIQALRTLVDVGDVQLFLPSLDNLVNPNIEGGVWTVDYVDDAGRFNFELGGQQLADAVVEILDDAYLDGVWDAEILGVSISEGRISATTSGYVVEGRLPFLDEPTVIRLGGSTVVVGGEETLLPSALLDVEFGTDELVELATSLGLPDILDPSRSAGGRLRIATPGYDVGSIDELLVRGGIEATAELSLSPFVETAEFTVSVFPAPGTDPFADDVLPDVVAVATVDRLAPLGGDQIEITNARIEVRRIDGVVSVTIQGETVFGGNAVAIDAQLAGDLTGVIDLSSGDGSITVGGFEIRGGARLELTRTSPPAPLVATLRTDLVVLVPPWLEQLIGTSEVTARGAIATDGTFDLELEIDQLDLPGTGLSIVGLEPESPPRLRFARTSEGVEVDVSGQLIGAAGLPVLVVDGTLDGDGNGTLDVSFPEGALTLGGFAVDAAASIERQGDTWSVGVSGTLSVPGILDNASVAGSIDSDGIEELEILVSSFGAGGLQVTDAELILRRTDPARQAYELMASGQVTAPGLGSTTAFVGSITSDGDVELVLTTTTRTIQGVAFANGTYTLRHVGSSDPTSTTIELAATATIAGQTGSVNGTLERVGNLWLGTLVLSIDGFQLGGVAIAGTLGLRFSASTTPSIDGACRRRRHVVDPRPRRRRVTVTGSVSTTGLGSLELEIDGLRPGGPDSPFEFTGSFERLERLLVDGRSGHRDRHPVRRDRGSVSTGPTPRCSIWRRSRSRPTAE
jgi:hypothetical protein